VQLRRGAELRLWPEVTFDDGHRSDVEIAAPILQARGLTARFFITAGWTGRRRAIMGWAELRSLHEAGSRFGAHGWVAQAVDTLPATDELQTELSKSRLTLEDKLGTPVPTMSLPGGRSNRRVLAACAAAGLHAGLYSIPRAEVASVGSYPLAG